MPDGLTKQTERTFIPLRFFEDIDGCLSMAVDEMCKSKELQFMQEI